MSELWLIAHKVRGEPAFDIACQMECPECNHLLKSGKINCTECDGEGFWWIIPTSGHRAYPWWNSELFHTDYKCVILLDADANGHCEVPPMPPSAPDHYTTRAAPKVDLATALGLRKPAAPTLQPLLRRL